MLHITKSHGSFPAAKHIPKPPEKSPPKSESGGGGRSHKPRSKADEREDEDANAEREQANTPPPEKSVDRTVVKLTNLQWKTDPIVIGGAAWVTLDVALPPEHENITGITVTVETQVKDGAWNQGAGSFRCDAKDGKAECEITELPKPPANNDGAPPEKVKYRFLAKHSYSRHAKGPEKEPGKGEPESPYDKIIYYSPASEEYLCIEDGDAYAAFSDEFENLRMIGELNRQAREAKDVEARKPISEKIAALGKEIWGEVGIVAESDPMAKEWLLVRQPKGTHKFEKRGKDDKRSTKEWKAPPSWAYTLPKSEAKGSGHKGKIVKATDPELRKNLDDLMKKPAGSKEHSPFFSGELTVKLFESDPLKTEKVLWKAGGEKTGKLAGQSFTFTKEAAVSRLVMQWDGTSGSVDLKNKQVHIGTGGSFAYGVLEGKMEGEIPLPEKGLNLLTLLGKHPYMHLVLEKNRRCLVRFKLGLSLKGFAGLSGNAAINILDINLENEKLSAGAATGVKAEGFAGAKADMGISVAFEWTSPERNKFEALAKLAGKGGASVGIGGEFEWKIEFRNGIFYFHGGASLTVALGLKGSFSVELGAAEGFHFIGYILQCMDFHFVGQIETAAFAAYKDIGYTLMVMGEATFTAEKKVIGNVVDNFAGIFSKTLQEIRTIKRELWDSTAHSSPLNNVPPEALGQALVTIMITREDKDFKSIMAILYSTVRSGADVKTDPSANHKLKWTLRAIAPILIPDTDGPETEKLKQDALKAGVMKIHDFGKGKGALNGNNQPASSNDSFLEEFHGFLKANMVVIR